MKKAKLLICDDDPELLKALELSFRQKFDVVVTSSVPQAQVEVASHNFDVAIIDLNFAGQELNGIELIDFMSSNSASTFLIVLSGDRNVQRVVQAHRRRLFDFILKDGEFFDALKTSIQQALAAKPQVGSNGVYRTESSKVKKLLQDIDRIMRSKVAGSVLIIGETGTGKEILAQHIANVSHLKLVAANMAAIPRETAESELFGHERGAFTGAIGQRIGLVEQAQGGIFFLDEVGECSLSLQAKLLRVIQEKEVLPLGGTKPRKLDLRFIAATNRDLDEMVASGEFRLDLLQRLNTFVLEIPPLRERREDILLYANLFLQECISPNESFHWLQDGIEALLEYRWPGNIRELKSVVQRIAVLSGKFDIDREAVVQAIGQQFYKARTSIALGVQIPTGLDAQVEQLQKDSLLQALDQAKGSRLEAARILGVSKATLYRWLQQHGIQKTN